MTIGTGLVLLITLVVIFLLPSLARPRRPPSEQGAPPRGYRRRRMDAIKRAAAADIAMIQGKDPSGAR
jgi:hypothetical protein